MTLSDYMAQQGLDDLAMAAILGIDRSSVYRIRHRECRPSWPVLNRLAEVTANTVMPNDFLVLAPSSRASRASTRRTLVCSAPTY